VSGIHPAGDDDAPDDAPDETPDDDARARLAAPPAVPLDADRLTSNELFGEPGVYPGGSPMVPAAGDALDAVTARRLLREAGLREAAERFDDAALAVRAPDAGPRAGLAALEGTIAAGVLDDFVAGRGRVRSVRLGCTSTPGRVVGVGEGQSVAGAAVRVVNDRYRAEHPALLAASLTHDLLWGGPDAGQPEECLLHALGAMVHVQLLARSPGLASLGTELARRQNSLAITLLNSRHPGSADLALIAPDGPGTIPGGAPAMQTPDFWSIPFVAGPPRATDAPPGAASLLEAALAPGTVLPAPLQWSVALGELLSTRLGRAWLPLGAQLRAARALGLVP
jgi:hypothetical protein